MAAGSEAPRSLCGPGKHGIKGHEGAWSLYLPITPTVRSRHPFFPSPAHELEGVGVLLHLHYGPRARAHLPPEGSTVTRW